MTQEILITGLTHYSPSPLEVIEQAKTQPIFLIKEDSDKVFWVSVDIDEWHEPTNAYNIPLAMWKASLPATPIF